MSTTTERDEEMAGYGEVVDEPSTQLVRAEAPTLSVAPQTTAQDLKARMALIREVMEHEMTENVDYGKVPGSQKPSLLKPGAEKLSATFRLDPQIRVDERFGPGDHLTVAAHATIFDAPSGARLGSGDGLCTTREKKYAKRKLERACPECSEHTIFESRKVDDPGFYCWKRKGGCGASFEPGDDRITAQEVGEIENPELPDTWNTVIKMARKRALVDAVLLVTGASAIFTQDVEDHAAQPTNGSAPPFGPSANEEQLVEAKAALGSLIGHGVLVVPAEDPSVTQVVDWIVLQAGGGFPEIVAKALKATNQQVLTAREEVARRKAKGTQEGAGDGAVNW